MTRGNLLNASGLSKSFPGVRALDRVDLEIEAGKVHVLVGENGAGKSTLMRILAGMERPDRGALRVKGRDVFFRFPWEAHQMGICMIHQELMPFPEMTVAENIFIGQEPQRAAPGWIDRRELNRRAAALLDRLGTRIPPNRPMKELGLAQMQMVEIARALARKAELILMDEPTSALSEPEVRTLFELIEELRKSGVAIIYVSHKMEEVFRIGDTVTVLRDGRRIGTFPTAESDRSRLISMMVGRRLEDRDPKPDFRKEPVLMAVNALGRKGAFRKIHFQIRAGEILGLAGLMGAGRTELLESLYGLKPAETGEIIVRGRKARINSPRAALRHGIGWAGENRSREGLVGEMSVEQNLTLSSLERCCRASIIDLRLESDRARKQVDRFRIRGWQPGRKVRFLSGGNQQKVVLAKMLLTQPDILLLDEPTRGIDVGAKAEIYELILSLAREGKAILLVSSELPELLSLTDRVLVMRSGEIRARLETPLTTQSEIMQYAMLN